MEELVKFNYRVLGHNDYPVDRYSERKGDAFARAFAEQAGAVES